LQLSDYVYFTTGQQSYDNSEPAENKVLIGYCKVLKLSEGWNFYEEVP
jgi:hypothetical protein